MADYEAKSDITLAELKSKPAAGAAEAAIATLCRFFVRHITLKNTRRMRLNNNARS